MLRKFGHFVWSLQDPRYRNAPFVLPNVWHGSGAGISDEDLKHLNLNVRDIGLDPKVASQLPHNRMLLAIAIRARSAQERTTMNESQPLLATAAGPSRELQDLAVAITTYLMHRKALEERGCTLRASIAVFVMSLMVSSTLTCWISLQSHRVNAKPTNVGVIDC